MLLPSNAQLLSANHYSKEWKEDIWPKIVLLNKSKGIRQQERTNSMKEDGLRRPRIESLSKARAGQGDHIFITDRASKESIRGKWHIK